MKKPGIKNQLIYVRSNFKIICESIVCSTKNSLAASHDKNEVCLSTRCEMNY
jgi:hypothetical protein